MEGKNPFSQGTYEWHNFEMQHTEPSRFGLVWVMNDFFYDSKLKRPKSFPKKDAHLYAIMFILNNENVDFVFVEDTEEYFRKKFSLKKT